MTMDSVAKLMSKTGDRLARLDGEIASLTAGIEAARRGRRAAIESVWRLEAQEKRAEAAKLRDQAAAIDRKAAPHFEALQQIYGCRFVPESSAIAAAAAVSMGADAQGATR